MLSYPLDNTTYEAEGLGLEHVSRSRGVLTFDDNLRVSAGGGMSVTVSPGVCLLKMSKYWAVTCLQKEALKLPIQTADGTLPRKDVVVARIDKIANITEIVVKAGTPASAPALPEIVRDSHYDEIFLAAVTVGPGVIEITNAVIQDLRMDESVCGLMIDSSAKLPTDAYNAQLTALLAQIEAELAHLHAGTAVMTKVQYDPAGGGVNICVQEYECTKSGSVYALVGEGAVGRFKVPTAWSAGDTWTVNGVAVPAYCGADAADGDCVVAGRWITFVYDGTRLDFNGGGGLSNAKLAQATATEGNVLAGKRFYAADKTLKEGTMPNRGAVDTTINPGSSYAVPAGYHNGEGRVKAATWTKDKYLYLVIQYQNGYGNPIPEYAATVVAQDIPEPGFLAHYSGAGNVRAVTNVCNANMLNIGAYAGNGTAQITPLTYLRDIFHNTDHDPGVVYALGPGVYCYRMR